MKQKKNKILLINIIIIIIINIINSIIYYTLLYDLNTLISHIHHHRINEYPPSLMNTRPQIQASHGRPSLHGEDLPLVDQHAGED